RLIKKFPFFFSYIATGFLIDAARLATYRGNPISYFYVYWISDSVGTLFAFLATGELILTRLFPRFHKVRFYHYLFWAAAVFVIGFTVVTEYSSKAAVLLPVLIRVLHTIDFLRVSIVIFFVALMMFMGRRWGQYEFGIAFGLGVNAAALLASFAIWIKEMPFRVDL